MDYLALADFNRVATFGGFGRASRATGQSKTTLSRRVRELEDNLGVRLIERGPRAFRLTEEGVALHTRTEALFGEIDEVAQAIRGGWSSPRGRLRVSVPTLFADLFMGRIAAAFAVQFPEIELEISADDRMVDHVTEGFDLVVRVNPGMRGDLVGRCFLREETLVVAPATLRRAPRKRGAGAPAPIPAVVMTKLPVTSVWHFLENGREVTLHARPVLRLSTFLMVREAVRAGLGAARLPRALVAEDLAAGRLVSWGVLTDRTVELWVLHTSRRLVSPKIVAFVDFLCETFPDCSA